MPRKTAITHPYNSALKAHPAEIKRRETLESVELFSNLRGTVFFHDMSVPFKESEMTVINGADCIYSHLAYPAGMKAFADRADYEQKGTHNQYLQAVKTLIDELRKPTFIVCSEKAANKLRPHKTRQIRLYKTMEVLACWEDYADEKHKTADEVSTYLSRRYNSVYDFSCGYGRSIREFDSIIGSDIDKKCLGYIKSEILEKARCENGKR